MKKITNGFTIIELLIIIAIIGILATIGLVSFSNIRADSRDSQRSSRISIIAEALEKYYEQNGEYPSCNAMSQSPSTITTNTLKGIDPDVLTVPTDASGTNSILTCAGGLTAGTDKFAYVGDNSTACSTGQACTQWTLEYREEGTGEIKTLNSRHHSPGTWKQIALGSDVACGIASNDQAYCWGGSFYTGEFGDNDNLSSWSDIPVAVYTGDVLNGKTLKTITRGADHTCAIASDNKVYCWGYNGQGRLGDNSTVKRIAPTAVVTAGTPMDGKTIVSITAGWGHTCALDSNGKVYCWGDNSDGQLGNNSIIDSPVPVAVVTAGTPMDGKTILSITAGYERVCTIDSDGKAYCWGHNNGSYGELGNNSTVNSPVPVSVYTSGFLSGKTLESISATLSDHTCVVDSNGQAYCWGPNWGGQLGNNSTTTSKVPVPVYTSGFLSGKTLVSIAVSVDNTCALDSNGQAYCWGVNYNGELGNNKTNSEMSESYVPVPVYTAGALSDKTVNFIAGGYCNTCVIASNGQAYCWGYNNHGLVGINSGWNNDRIQFPVAIEPPY